MRKLHATNFNHVNLDELFRIFNGISKEEDYHNMLGENGYESIRDAESSQIQNRNGKRPEFHAENLIRFNSDNELNQKKKVRVLK